MFGLLGVAHAGVRVRSWRGMTHPFRLPSLQVTGLLLTLCYWRRTLLRPRGGLADERRAAAARLDAGVPRSAAAIRARQPDVADDPGAYSPRKVDPLAREFVELLLVDEDTPSYVKAAAYRAELWSLGRAEAQVQLITEWLASRAEDTDDGVGDLTSEAVRSAYSAALPGGVAGGVVADAADPGQRCPAGKHIA